MPEIDLFVVSIKTIQQQGIELTEELESVVPYLIDEVKYLLKKNYTMKTATPLKVAS
jgi:hydrogenase maturation protease